MSYYRGLLEGLKDQSTAPLKDQSTTSSQSSTSSTSATNTRTSTSHYRNILDGLKDQSITPSQSPPSSGVPALPEVQHLSEFSRFSAQQRHSRVHNLLKDLGCITHEIEQVQHLIDQQASPGGSLEFLLLPDNSGRRELFGDSKLRSLHTTKALFHTFGLDNTIQQLTTKLSTLSDRSPPTLISNTLEEMEAALHDTRGELLSITIEGAAQEVEDAQKKLEILKQ